jgi:aspartate 1-decarboxylase
MKSKIHRATVTQADLDYVGSVTIDPVLLEAADLLVNERVEIYNCTTGERLATYAIPGERGDGQICINGAAAHKAGVGDVVIICSYAEMEDHEARELEPLLVFVDERNRIVRQTRGTEPAGTYAAALAG